MPYTAATTGASIPPIFHYPAGNSVVVVPGSGGGDGVTPDPKNSGIKRGV